MSLAILSLGSNLGERYNNLKRVLLELEKLGKIVNKSHTYETKPYGVFDQPNFLNMAVGIETELPPRKLLEKLKSIEKKLGRKETRRWGERIIDIDILFYDEIIVDEPGLKIPHPEIQYREFVLKPLREIYPDFVHPTLKKTVRELFQKLPDIPFVASLEVPPGRFFFAVKEDKILRTSFFEIKGRMEMNPTILKLKDELERYFHGEKMDFEGYKLEEGGLSAYARRVYNLLRRVRWGETITYKKLAELSGKPDGQRAIGRLMATNPFPIIVPCHRVIRTNGKIGGFGGGVEWKKFLLRLEGHNF